MDVSIGDGSECDPTHRQVLAPDTPPTVRVNPRLRTAMRAARVGDRRSAPSRRGAVAGSPFPRRARRSSSLVGVAA